MTVRLRVNPILCDGYGHCAELLPEMLELDEWGYPIVPAEPVPRRLVPAARRRENVPTPCALARREAAMTPRARDENRARVRRYTSAIAGAALAACGLFAGLAASATRHAFSTARTTTATVVKKAQPTTVQRTTTTTAPVVVMPTQAAPAATSGGS